MKIDRILEFYPQFFFFKIFNQTIQCLVVYTFDQTQKIKRDQDASALVTEFSQQN